MGAAEDIAVDRKKGVAFAQAVGRLLHARHGDLFGARRRQHVVHTRGRGSTGSVSVWFWSPCVLLQSHLDVPRDGGSLPSARACASSWSHVRIVELVSPCLHSLVLRSASTKTGCPILFRCENAATRRDGVRLHCVFAMATATILKLNTHTDSDSV